MAFSLRSLAVWAVALARISHATEYNGSTWDSTLVCKVSPGTPEWPDRATWASFNQTVSGKLLQPPPPAAVVYDSLYHWRYRSTNVNACTVS